MAEPESGQSFVTPTTFDLLRRRNTILRSRPPLDSFSRGELPLGK